MMIAVATKSFSLVIGLRGAKYLMIEYLLFIYADEMKYSPPII